MRENKRKTKPRIVIELNDDKIRNLFEKHCKYKKTNMKKELEKYILKNIWEDYLEEGMILKCVTDDILNIKNGGYAIIYHIYNDWIRLNNCEISMGVQKLFECFEVVPSSKIFKIGRRLRAKNNKFGLKPRSVIRITEVIENDKVHIGEINESIEYEDIIMNFDIL